MTNRTPQFLNTVLFGAAVLTAFTLVIPRILSARPTPAVAEVPTATTAESAPGDVALIADSSVDMNHWQETAQQPSNYTPGKTRKGK